MKPFIESLHIKCCRSKKIFLIIGCPANENSSRPNTNLVLEGVPREDKGREHFQISIASRPLFQRSTTSALPGASIIPRHGVTPSAARDDIRHCRARGLTGRI